MPRSKRSKVTTLTKTASRTTKASKLALVQEIQNEIDKYDHVWLFSVGDMRNEGLKEVRSQWRGTGRMFFGKGRVMQKALGIDEANEYKEGLHRLADKLTGQMGLFLTSHPVDLTLEWFESYSRPEYARQNHLATRDITIPSGPILTPYNDGSEVDADGKPLGDPFPHSMEPQLRQLGLSTSLIRGVPSLNSAHVLCKKGEKLSSEKCRVLKLLGVQMSQFRIHLGSRWSKEEGFVEGKDLTTDELNGEADEDEEDEGMDA